MVGTPVGNVQARGRLRKLNLCQQLVHNRLRESAQVRLDRLRLGRTAVENDRQRKHLTFPIHTSTDDAYSDRDNSIARFDSIGTFLREIFGAGDFEQSPSVAIDSATGTAYVSVLQAEGATRNEVKIYKTAITPDITDASASTGPTNATVGADIGTAGAGNVTGCKLQ